VPDRIDALEQLLKSVSRSVFDLARSAMHNRGLPAQTMPVLGHVTKNPGTTVSEIARRTQLAKSHISNTVDSLCEKGFLEKRADPDDQRLVRIYATPRAQGYFRELHESVRRSLSEALSTLPDEKVEAIMDGLQALDSVLEQLRNRD
jgi:DNA-binding MarR family transcriptional regulator